MIYHHLTMIYHHFTTIYRRFTTFYHLLFQFYAYSSEILSRYSSNTAFYNEFFAALRSYIILSSRFYRNCSILFWILSVFSLFNALLSSFHWAFSTVNPLSTRSSGRQQLSFISLHPHLSRFCKGLYRIHLRLEQFFARISSFLLFIFNISLIFYGLRMGFNRFLSKN